MTDQQSSYAAEVECAIGLNAEGVYAARDAVLAVRDREMERLKLLVAASSEPGQAVRMAAQYADRAIENGKRAEEAEAERNRVQQRACLLAERLRKAEAERERLRAELDSANRQIDARRIELLRVNERHAEAALDEPQQPTTAELREQANTWRGQANQRAFLLSRYQGLLVAIREFVAEETTPTNGWGDGYRDAKRDLVEILDAFAPDTVDQPQQPEGAEAPLNP